MLRQVAEIVMPLDFPSTLLHAIQSQVHSNFSPVVKAKSKSNGKYRSKRNSSSISSLAVQLGQRICWVRLYSNCYFPMLRMIDQNSSLRVDLKLFAFIALSIFAPSLYVPQLIDLDVSQCCSSSSGELIPSPAIIIMLIKRQQLASVPHESLKKRNSVTFHVSKQQQQRKRSLKASLDFNSQLLANQNRNDFNTIVTSIKQSMGKRSIDIPKPSAKRLTSEVSHAESPFKVVRYPFVRSQETFGNSRIVRSSTQPTSVESPQHLQLNRKQALLSIPEDSKRYQSPSRQIKWQISKLFPQVRPRRLQSFSQTVTYNGERIKPWETKRDFFHQTFKRYIAQNRRYQQWPSIDPSSSLQ